MSSDLDHLRSLDHEQLSAFIDELEPDPDAMTPDEVAAVLAGLDAADPDAPIEVLPSLRRAA